MSSNLHPIFQQALAPFIQPLTEAQAREIDMAMLEDKKIDGYGRREERRAMRLQLQQMNTGEFV